MYTHELIALGVPDSRTMNRQEWRVVSGYNCWRAMNRRCLQPSVHNFHRWGGVGIKLHADWQGPEGFRRFIEHIGPRPSLQHSIDRWPNPFGNYEPGNVRWATPQQQVANTRSPPGRPRKNGFTRQQAEAAKRIAEAA